MLNFGCMVFLNGELVTQGGLGTGSVLNSGILFCGDFCPFHRLLNCCGIFLWYTSFRSGADVMKCAWGDLYPTAQEDDSIASPVIGLSKSLHHCFLKHYPSWHHQTFGENYEGFSLFQQ